MGWRERDWAKFSDEEWAAYLGRGRRDAPLPPSREVEAHLPGPIVPAPSRKGVSRRRQRIGEAVLGSLLALGALSFAYQHAHRSNGSLSFQPSGPLPAPVVQVGTTTVALQPAPDVIRVEWRAIDLAPANAAGRICVTDETRGRICASYVLGEVPADALVRQIEAAGLHAESVGDASAGGSVLEY